MRCRVVYIRAEVVDRRLRTKSTKAFAACFVAFALFAVGNAIFVLPQSTGTTSFSIPDRGAVSLSTTGGPGTTAVGYGRIQPDAGSAAPSGLAIFGFRQNGILVTEAGVPAAPAIQNGRFFAEINGRANTGLAIANPNAVAAQISFNFAGVRSAGSTSPAPGSLVIPPNGQIAAFLNELPFNATAPFIGTFTFSSTAPVFITALRGFTNERSEFLITTLPVADLATAPTNETLYFPHFAAGGGWSTQLVLVNATDTDISGTAAFFDQGSATSPGQPAVVTIDGAQASSFTYSIPARSVQRLTTSGIGALRVGSVQVTPDSSMSAPFGVAIFSFVSGGITVTQAGVPTVSLGNAFRLYAETFGNFAGSDPGSIQTGVAITNPSPNPVNVNFELTTLSATAAGSMGSTTVPGRGQVAMFINQIPGIGDVPSALQGVLRISTASPAGVAVVGLRGRYNERGDFLITTTPPARESGPAVTGEVGFAHLAEAGGWSTQFVMFGGQSGTNAGNLRLVSQSGQTLALTLNTNLLALSGTATLNAITPFGVTDYNFQIVFRNITNETVTLERGEIFWNENGGWGVSRGERLSNTVFSPGFSTTLNGRVTLGNPGSHVTFQLRATTASGKAQDLFFQMPIPHTGYTTPPEIPAQSQTPVYLGVEEPVETYVTATVGTVNSPPAPRAIVIKARVMNGTGKDITINQWNITLRRSTGAVAIARDVTASVDYTPAVFTNPNNSMTHSLVFNFSVPTDFTTGTLTQQVRLTMDGQAYLLQRTCPVTLAEIATDRQFPLVGGFWRLGSSPDITTGASYPPLHLFEADLNKYAFDITMAQTATGPAFSGNAGVNESYFAWNQPVYAMEDGVVLYSLNTTPDNNGNLQDVSFNMSPNSVIMQNDAGQYDLYFHFRQGSVAVTAGQRISRGTLLGRIGNSGLSLSPHLHVQSYALDNTGFAKALSLSFLNLVTPANLTVSGVPASGTYQAK